MMAAVNPNLRLNDLVELEHKYRGEPGVRQVILNQIEQATSIVPGALLMTSDEVAVAWGLPWSTVVDIHYFEVELGRPVFFEQGYIGSFCVWPVLMTTQHLQARNEDTVIQLTRTQSITVNLKYHRMSPRNRASLTGDDVLEWHDIAKEFIRQDMPQPYREYIERQIDLYDPRQQQSRSKAWTEYRRFNPPSFLIFETIRCTEMGMIPLEMMVHTTESNCQFFLNQDQLYRTRSPQLFNPTGVILELRQIILSEGRSTFENDLLHWREHGSWPARRTPTDWRALAEERETELQTRRDSITVLEGEVAQVRQELTETKEKLRLREPVEGLRAELAMKVTQIEELEQQLQEVRDRNSSSFLRRLQSVNELDTSWASYTQYLASASVGFAVSRFGPLAAHTIQHGLVMGWDMIVAGTEEAKLRLGRCALTLGRYLTGE
ncbi:hypothetical protein M434DRAFT_103954 [Hypoxylon sp. CO27-5]|nr:hypothetical protein M434DRAFT_103954 [Hypoxylon sp. CO27-5]